jgi:deoxyxylulose-5-phosphate synthase
MPRLSVAAGMIGKTMQVVLIYASSFCNVTFVSSICDVCLNENKIQFLMIMNIQ